MASENEADHVHTDDCYVDQDEQSNNMSEAKIDHSVIEDPAFKMFNNIQHALDCDKVACDHHACAPTRTLLTHVYACIDETCEYPNCGEAIVLLDHYADPEGIQGHNAAGCPLCRKRAVLMRIHPGKGPRSFDDEEEEEKKNKEAPAATAKDNCSIIRKRLAPIQRSSTYSSAKRARLAAIEQARTDKINEEMRIVIRERKWAKLREEFIDLYEHTRTCKVLCQTQNCLGLKRMLIHINRCKIVCGANYCNWMKKLIIHYKYCEPQDIQCATCFKHPPYRGKDYFADMNADVLRNIARLLQKNAKSLNALQQVNKRVYSFFNFPGEIKGLFPKEKYEALLLEQLRDGSVSFLFCNKSSSSGGYFHVFNKNGQQESMRFSGSNREMFSNYMKTNYGILGHAHEGVEPIHLPPSFFDGLSLALQKCDFVAFHACSVILNFGELNKFFTEQREEGSGHFFVNMAIRLRNVRIL